MSKIIKIVGIAGSLRRASFNKALLRAAQELIPPEATLELIEIADLPLFNQDQEQSLPAPVEEFKNKIQAADAIILATPEYNYSFSGVLKNALDWGSRPFGQNSWADKPVAVMGASSSNLGTGRAQYQLRQTFVYLNMHALNRPEVLVAKAGEKFDQNLRLVDEPTRAKVVELLTALVAWTKRLRGLPNDI